MDDIEAYIGDDEHKEWKVEFDKLFGEKIPSKTNATKSVRKVKFAVIRKWFVEKREGEEAEKAKKAREAAAKKAKRTNKKATDEDKAVEQNVPLEVANNSQQEQLDLVSNRKARVSGKDTRAHWLYWSLFSEFSSISLSAYSIHSTVRRFSEMPSLSQILSIRSSSDFSNLNVRLTYSSFGILKAILPPLYIVGENTTKSNALFMCGINT